MTRIAIFVIKIYRILLSPALYTLFGKACKYKISCSQYASDSLKKHGFVKGTALSLKRFVSCNNF